MRRPFALAVSVIIVAAPMLAARGDGGRDLHVAGFMPFDLKAPVMYGSAPNSYLKFVVDPGVHRGFLLINDGGGPRIAVYDLVRLRRIAFIPWPAGADLTGIEATAVDEVHHRIYIASILAAPGVTACDAGTRIVVVDTARLTTKASLLPCVGGQPFAVEGLFYDAGGHQLYGIGMPAGVRAFLSSESGANVFKEPTMFLQIDPDTLQPAWMVDATSACDWHETGTGGTTVPGLVSVVDDRLLSFCYAGGAAYNFGGVRGTALVMQLENGKPVTTPLGPSIRTSPTFTGDVSPMVDPATGRLLIYAASPPYGRAVWGYDPVGERFVGVVPAGEEASGSDDVFQGFDQATGRLYVTNRRGIVLVDARQPVLSGGVTYPALAGSAKGNPINPAVGYAHDLEIDGRLRRVFVPYPKKNGFIVVQDDVPIPPPPPVVDLDQGTADIPEVAGKTASAFSGSADSFGLHVVNVGGIPGAIANNDQTCFAGSPIRERDPYGRCLAEQYVTPGNRESFTAQTGLELGSDSGATAFGAVFRVPANDSATDADFRSLATCFMDRMPEQVPGSVRDGVAPFCRDQTPLGAFRDGTQDAEGRDAPFPGASCVDETGKATGNDLSAPIGRSAATCDRAANSASASADTAAVALPDTAAPVLSVAHASSSIETVRTAKGLVTTVTASASGIRIAGTFTIGRVVAKAVTVAHGRTGSTSATFERLISDVHGPGIDCAATCEPQAVVDAFNRAFASQARMRTPSPLSVASPRGYQGLVVKDPSLRASDIAILNDDTDTFNGLDLILNNDGFNLNTSGPNARSRLVISFAGVHAESRYGIFPVSAGGGGTDVPAGPPPVLPPLPPIEPIAPEAPAIPPVPVPAPLPPVARLITDTWRLIVNHPGQAAVLFVLLGLLASPLYLGLRSRSLARSLR